MEVEVHEDELDFDLGTGLTIINIVLQDDEPPEIDLDGCHPLVAAQIFRDAAEMLESMMERPVIRTHGQIIAADEEYLYETQEEDE